MAITSYTIKTSVVTVTTSATQIVAADRDRIFLQVAPNGDLHIGGSDVTYATGRSGGYEGSGPLAMPAVYGIRNTDTVDVLVFEVTAS